MTFVPDKQFGPLITITMQSLTMLKITNPDISQRFTDPSDRPLEIGDNVNITLIIGAGEYKWDIQLNQEKENMLKYMASCYLLENLEINMVKKWCILQQKQE